MQLIYNKYFKSNQTIPDTEQKRKNKANIALMSKLNKTEGKKQMTV